MGAHAEEDFIKARDYMDTEGRLPIIGGMGLNRDPGDRVRHYCP